MGKKKIHIQNVTASQFSVGNITNQYQEFSTHQFQEIEIQLLNLRNAISELDRRTVEKELLLKNLPERVDQTTLPPLRKTLQYLNNTLNTIGDSAGSVTNIQSLIAVISELIR